ncbi:MAG: DNA-binding protein WhiA [Erysipelotrichales bacterium]|nr:DNA-binding protein WhiA [Erysipelotrichales bacterium]
MNEKQSFTSRVKEEVASQLFEGVKLRALLSSFSKINGKLVIENNETKIVLQTENAKIAKFIFLAFQTRYNISPRFAYRRSMHFNKKIVYHIIIENKVEEILEDLEMLSYEGNTKSFVRSEESLAGFVTGAFLASGSVNNPESSNYHLEISTNDEDLTNYIMNVIKRVRLVEFTPKMIKRRNQYVVYLKKGEQIANLLVLISASESCLEFENIRVNRDFYNNDNRLQICADANMARTADAAKKQIEDIKLIDTKIGIKNIPNIKMKELMKLRLDYDGASMLELSELLSEKLEKNISKSAINHLFRAIKELADRLRHGGQND